MKTRLTTIIAMTYGLIAITSAVAKDAALPIGEPESAPAIITTIQPQPEIERLQQEFARRRAEALRPVAAWYREQLETLQKKLFYRSTRVRSQSGGSPEGRKGGFLAGGPTGT